MVARRYGCYVSPPAGPGPDSPRRLRAAPWVRVPRRGRHLARGRGVAVLPTPDRRGPDHVQPGVPPFGRVRSDRM